MDAGAAAVAEDAAPPSAPSGPSGPSGPSALPTITAEEIATAVKVLQALGASQELFFSPPMKPIRKVLEPVLKLHESRKFGGADKDAYHEAKVASKTVTLLKNQQKQLEKAFVDKTALRAARLQKLSALAEQGAGAALLVPDGAASDLPLNTGAEALLLKNRPEGEEDSGRNAAMLMLEDKSAEKEEGEGSAASVHQQQQLIIPPSGLNFTALVQACYCCKARFKNLHHFYSHLCPRCASLNWEKRNQTCDLTGHIALVTGSRVKIGFQTTLKLLRAGARVIATTRFPHDAAERYASLPDFETWRNRLEIVGLDLRDLPTLERFCASLKERLPYLTIVINNACQTVRRPPAFYKPLLAKELKSVTDLPAHLQPLVKDAHSHVVGDRWAGRLLESAKGTAKVLLDESEGTSSSSSSLSSPSSASSSSSSSSTSTALVVAAGSANGAGSAGAGAARGMTSAAMSQLAVVPGDEVHHEEEFPDALVDVNGQQIDLRTQNSWTMRMHEIDTGELAEVFCINAMAPFIIAARLKELMVKGREKIPPFAQKDNWKKDDPATVDALKRYLTPALREALLGETITPDESVAATPSNSSTSSSGGAGAGAGAAPPAKRPRGDDSSSALPAHNPHSHQAQKQKRLLKGVGTMLGEVAGADIPVELCRFIVNVSAMEGKFARSKTPNHPHTNAAKAALNMEVRTSAGDYASEMIFMTAVDTGWINEENPAAVAAKTAAKHNFQTPIDEIDAAARILAPIFDAVIEAQKKDGDGSCRPVFGGFLKDYFLSEW